MRKKNIIRKPPTEVHTYRCTEEELKRLQTHAKECGLSLSRYVVEKFMRWWIDAVAGLIQHWYSIEENIATNVQTKSKE